MPLHSKQLARMGGIRYIQRGGLRGLGVQLFIQRRSWVSERTRKAVRNGLENLESSDKEYSMGDANVPAMAETGTLFVDGHFVAPLS